MTTSTNTTDEVNSRAGVKVQSWEDDTLGDTHVQSDGDGGSEFHYRICDMSFEEAWLQSDVSKNLKKMR